MSSPDPKPVATLRREFTWRKARRLPFGLAVLATVVAVFYLEENMRGRRAWAEVRAEAESLGLSFDLGSLKPPAVSGADDFSTTPLIAQRSDHGMRSGPSVEMKLQPPNGLAGREPDYSAAEGETWGFPLDGWRTYLGQPDLDAYLAPVNADLDEIARACRGERVRLALDPLAPNGLAGAIRRAGDAFAMRAALRLEQGKPAGGAADLATIWRLAERLQDHPEHYFQWQSFELIQKGLYILRAGLERRVWSEVELAEFEAGLSRLDAMTLPYARRVWQADFAREALVLTEIAEGPRSWRRINESNGLNGEIAKLRGYWFAPRGWIYQNLAITGRIYLREVIPAVIPADRQVKWKRLMELQDRVKAGGLGSYPLAKFGEERLRRIGEKGRELAAMQTRLNLGRVAIALERHRLQHGVFPPSLAVLPAPVGALRDEVGGLTFRYRRDGQSGFRLHGPGANGWLDLVW